MPARPRFSIPRTCVLTIQGGGALAVELLGQLQGVVGDAETPDRRPSGDHGMDVVGIAGTSAGAVIATLYWAGYRPHDILDEIEDLFRPAALNDLFGPYRRRKLRDFAAVARFLERARHVMFSPDWRPWPLGWLLPGPRRFLARLRFGLGVWLRHGWMFRHQGILSGENLERRIDTLLKRSDRFRHAIERRPADRHDDPLTFREARACCPGLVPLFLLVTDVAAGTALIVGSIDAEWLDVPIARAARASAGFPGFFRPVAVGPHACCIDGGVMSNIPTWVFDRAFRDRLERVPPAIAGEDSDLRRLAALPWHHVALRLAPEPAGARPQGGAGFIMALWKLLSGVAQRRLESQMFQLVATKRFVIEPDPAAAADAAITEVLDFAGLGDRAKLEAMFRRGRQAAQATLARHADRFLMPPEAAMTPVLAQLVAKVTAVLAPHLAPGGRVRGNVFLPLSDQSLRIAAAHGMDADHIDVDIDISAGSVTSLCYMARRPILANLADRLLVPQPHAEDLARMDPFRARAQPNVNWLLSVPLPDVLDAMPTPPTPAGRLLMSDQAGPIFGVVNVDAGVNYGATFPQDPLLQIDQPILPMIFDAASAAARQLSRLINRPWLEDLNR